MVLMLKIADSVRMTNGKPQNDMVSFNYFLLFLAPMSINIWNILNDWFVCFYIQSPFIYSVTVAKVKAFSFTISYVIPSGFSLNTYILKVGLKTAQTCKDLLYVPLLFILLENFLCHLLGKLSWSISLLTDALSMSNRCAGLMQLYEGYPSALRLNRHFYSQHSCWNPRAFQWQGRNQTDLITI